MLMASFRPFTLHPNSPYKLPLVLTIIMLFIHWVVLSALHPSQDNGRKRPREDEGGPGGLFIPRGHPIPQSWCCATPRWIIVHQIRFQGGRRNPAYQCARCNFMGWWENGDKDQIFRPDGSRIPKISIQELTNRLPTNSP